MSHPLRADYAQVLLLPPCVEDWVAEQHPVRFVRDFVDSLDLPTLSFSQSPGTEGRPHFAAELLLKVWLYGWMDRTRTSRMLEKACMERMPYIWLTGNLHPDHNTLWRFFRDNKKALRKLFKRVVQVAVDAELVGFALHALDGTKIQAAASMESALHRDSLAEQLKRIDQFVDEAIKTIEVGEQSEAPGFAMPQPMRDDRQRKATIVEALARLDAEDTNHLHPQDPEARVMKSRQGTILGYNAQAVVDHDSDLIVADDVVSDEFDNAQLVPMIDQVLKNTGEVAEATTADGGYFNGEQIDEAQRRHLPIMVNLREDTTEKGELKKAFFRYDEDQDCYTCPMGKTLKFWRVEQPSKGKPYPRRVYRCTQCGCPQGDRCTKSKAGRTIKRTPFEPAVERQKQTQDNPAAVILLALRREIIEHTFGIIKHNHGFRRFTVRTIEAVRAQWSLMCTAFNLLKLHAFWRQGTFRLGA